MLLSDFPVKALMLAQGDRIEPELSIEKLDQLDKLVRTGRKADLVKFIDIVELHSTDLVCPQDKGTVKCLRAKILLFSKKARSVLTADEVSVARKQIPS